MTCLGMLEAQKLSCPNANFSDVSYVYQRAALRQARTGIHHSRRQAMTSVFDRDDIQFQVVVNH